MDSESEDTVQEVVTLDSKQLSFMTILKDHPVLLNKSQLPAIKSKKDRCFDEVISKLNKSQGQTFDRASLSSKISRMKNDVKKKCDSNVTGNQRIALKPWEKIMFDLINAETNPSIAKIPGAVSDGPRKFTSAEPSVKATPAGKMENSGAVSLGQQSKSDPPKSSMPSFPSSTNAQRSDVKSPPDSNRKRKSAEAILDSKETDETRLLSNTQLQRLVLLEQLAVLKMKRLRMDDSNPKLPDQPSPVYTFVLSPDIELHGDSSTDANDLD